MADRPDRSTVLFVSYDGLLEPLGESQVFGYLRLLAREHRVFLLTFEKPLDWENRGQMQRMAERCLAAGIHWQPLKYHKRPSLFATAWDVVSGIWLGAKLGRSEQVAIVHARSYVAAVIALGIKKLLATPYLFDTRGFWVEERVDGGLWKKGSTLFRLAVNVEKTLFASADFVTCLTEPAREIIASNFPCVPKDRITVIPTCVDLDSFEVCAGGNPRYFTLGYVGSVGTWYRFDQVLEVVRLLFDQHEHSRFLIANRGQHELIHRMLDERDIDRSRVRLLDLKSPEVPAAICEMSAGIVFCKQVRSKLASVPTRLAEFLACGRPVMCNDGLGGMETLLTQRRVGIGVRSFERECLKRAVTELVAIAGETGIRTRCREVAVEKFSKRTGAESYSRIYSTILENKWARLS